MKNKIRTKSRNSGHSERRRLADCLCLKRRAARAASRRRQAVTDGRFETREQHQLKKLLQRSETCAAARVRFCRVLCVFLQLQCYEATKKLPAT